MRRWKVTRGCRRWIRWWGSSKREQWKRLRLSGLWIYGSMDLWICGRELARDWILDTQKTYQMYWPHREQAPSHGVGWSDAFAASARSSNKGFVVDFEGQQLCFCPEGVGVRLADDGLRSGPKPESSAWQTRRVHRFHCRFPADRRTSQLPRPAARIKITVGLPVCCATARRLDDGGSPTVNQFAGKGCRLSSLAPHRALASPSFAHPFVTRTLC
jgi:hypothetical protein